MVDGGRLCLALLALVPFTFDYFESYSLRNEDVSTRISAAEDVPQFLPQGGLALWVLDFVVGDRTSKLAYERGQLAAFVGAVRGFRVLDESSAVRTVVQA